MAFDEVRRQIVLYAGSGMSGTPGSTGRLGDVWEWDGSEWSDVSTAFGAPAQRYNHAAAYSPERAAVTLFGGQTVNSPRTDEAWEWSGDRWQNVNSFGIERPRTSTHHTLTYDRQSRRILLLGGPFPTQGDENPMETWTFRFASRDALDEDCLAAQDTDGDGLAGCDDPDCWAHCHVNCSPGMMCTEADLHCGDGQCNQALESAALCPMDGCP